MIKDNKIVTANWEDYNNVVDTIVDSMNYDLITTKIELISSTMKIAEIMSYDIKIKFGSINIPRGNDD
jgi:hypothetical protein